MYTVLIYKGPFDLTESGYIKGVSDWRVQNGVLMLYQKNIQTCYPLTSIGRFESVKEEEQ